MRMCHYIHYTLYYTYINTIIIRNSFIILSQTYRNQNLIILLNVKINYHAIMLGQSVNYTQHNSEIIVIILIADVYKYILYGVIGHLRVERKTVQGKR